VKSGPAVHPFAEVGCAARRNLSANQSFFYGASRCGNGKNAIKEREEFTYIYIYIYIYIYTIYILYINNVIEEEVEESFFK
jgi:hypothetical protein